MEEEEKEEHKLGYREGKGRRMIEGKAKTRAERRKEEVKMNYNWTKQTGRHSEWVYRALALHCPLRFKKHARGLTAV